MNAARRASTVRFTPPPPSNPQDWRRRVQAAHDYAPLPDLALLIALAAAALPPEATKSPMNRDSFQAIKHEFALQGLPRPTHDEMCTAIAQLDTRNLAAPWWKITEAQRARFAPEGVN